MRTSCSAALLLALTACAAPAPRDPVVDVLVEAHRTLVPGGDGELAPLRRKIEARCDNLIHAHEPGYRAADGLGDWDMRPGRLERTERQLDLAIDGDGFFRVRRADGTIAFTRGSHFELDENGNILVAGCLLDPPATLPQNITRVQIDSTGFIQGFDPANPQALQAIGQIELTRFINPERLEAIDVVLFRETPPSGNRIDGTPGHGSLGTVRQGFLESSNVDTLATVASLVEDLRRYRIALEAWRIKREFR